MYGEKRSASNVESEPASKRPRFDDSRNSVETVMATALHDPTTDEALAGVNFDRDAKIRLLMGSEFVGLVIGKGGATIKALMAKSEARIQVGKEEDLPPGSKQRLVRIEGSIKTISLAQQALTALIQGEGSDPEKQVLEILIPSSAGGIIIGKGGETVRNLIDTCGAHISLSNVNPGTPDRVVTVTGPALGLARAQVLICHKIEEARMEAPGRYEVQEVSYNRALPVGGMGGALPMFGGPAPSPFGGPSFGAPAGDGPSATATLNVKNADAGSIIGRGGSVIKQLQAMTGTRIQISETTPGTEYRAVKITGPSSAVAHAQHLVHAAIAQGASQQQPKFEPPPLGDGPTVTSTLQVTNAETSVIIGRSGNVIKQIQTSSGARIHISDHEAGAQYRTVSITGSQASVDNATRQIQKILSEPSSGPPPAVVGNDSIVEMQVTQNQIGAVIGHGGETIKAIQSQAGVKIKISDFDPSATTRTVAITGTSNAVAHAQQLVEAALHGDLGGVHQPQAFSMPMGGGGMGGGGSYQQGYGSQGGYGGGAGGYGASQPPYGASAQPAYSQSYGGSAAPQYSQQPQYGGYGQTQQYGQSQQQYSQQGYY